MVTNIGAALGNFSLATLIVDLLMQIPVQRIGLGILWDTKIISRVTGEYPGKIKSVRKKKKKKKKKKEEHQEQEETTNSVPMSPTKVEKRKSVV